MCMSLWVCRPGTGDGGQGNNKIRSLEEEIAPGRQAMEKG